MNKKISIGAAITLIIIMAAATFCITMMYTWQRFNISIGDLTAREQMYSKLSKVDNIVRTEFVGKIDDSKVTDDLIAGYISGLGDKHSLYFDKATNKQFADDISGQSSGLGIDFNQDSKTNDIYVVRVIGGSPAETAGVQAGDVIIKVNGQSATDLGYDNSIAALRGDNGTTADFTVSRTVNGTAQQIDFSIVRAAYTAKTVDYRVISPDIGYIRIYQFGDNTTEEFRVALDALTNQDKVKSLIFDVRNNPGGLLDSAAKIIDKLVPKGNIVSATYKDGSTKVLFTSDANEVNLPMAVLMNENTASAAELFSCDLKDYKKAVLVGVNTYGKGTMQNTIELGDGTALDLSIAKFNPYKSPNFDGKGIAPNIIVQMPDSLESHIYELTEKNDPQLIAAINALKGSAK